MTLAVVLNGKPREFPGLDGGATLAEVVLELGLKADRIALERNGEIVPRAGWGEVKVNSGDKLEVVHFVGGGTLPATHPRSGFSSVRSRASRRAG